MEAIAQQAISTLPQFVPQDISNIAWSFATLPIDHEPLLEAISAEALRKLADFETQDLCNTAWAFATLG